MVKIYKNEQALFLYPESSGEKCGIPADFYKNANKYY